jgi:Protein of unknown function (DUF1553)/Protein of unknown function (DUF1549)/Concanavalin A-like lectin/glucanases superfamily/Planctomycete cytochrome C
MASRALQVCFSAFAGLLISVAMAMAAAPEAAGPVEFNRDIRPILSDKCFTCHGPDAANRKTKLRFDLETAAKAELRPGRYAIVPGNLAASELYRRVSSDDKAVRMPPAYAGREKLTDHEIQLIRTWIEQGAVWQPFWSFVPPKLPALPKVSDPAWVRNPIDAFILRRLEKEGLHPSPEADRQTLIRRVSLDLTGIPPTPAEVDAFLADQSAGAYEKVVDRLLASPRYGERMAYRWMEAARYGDTNGYQTDGPREMWRWRDWVIAAFNSNMPFDRFTTEQIAGDLLPNSTLDQKIATGFNRNHRTNGEGGIIPEEYRVEYVADRAQTTATVWMGVTLGCARCHDHKYDPFPQRDFYRLFAYFNQIPDEKGLSFNYGNEEPYIKAPLEEQKRELLEFDRKITAAQQHYDGLQPALAAAQTTWEDQLARSKKSDWTVTEGLVFQSKPDLESKTLGCDKDALPCLIPTEGGPVGEAWHFDGKRFLEVNKAVARFGYLDPFTFSAWIKSESGTGGIFSQQEDYFEGTGHALYVIDGKLRLHVVDRWTDLALRMEAVAPLKLNEWQHVLVTYDGKRKARGVRFYNNGELQPTNVLFDQMNEPFHVDEKVPFRIGAAGGLRFSGSIEDVRVYNRALPPDEAAAVSARESLSQIAAMASVTRTHSQSAKLAQAFLAQAAPPNIQSAWVDLTSLQQQREKFYDSIPTVMVMLDAPKPRETFLLKRGVYDAPAEPVTPGVPEILPQPPANWPSNRLGLARWLVDLSNPLTARVTVNRYWQSYFGFGIVKTVDDFGSQGEWPVHPELLDWLAAHFVESGWNVKAIQKLIVTSATYRQASKVTPELLEKDPDNRLLARGPRVRLGPEVIRDQALEASGLLMEKLGGPSVKPYQPAGLWQELADGTGYVQDKGPSLYRRSLYTYWKRTVAPPFMTNFDAPNREVCTVYENRTNTPLQALDLMNDVAFLEASRKLAERLVVEGGSTPQQRINYGFRLVLARPAKPAEQEILQKTLAGFESNYRQHPTEAEQYLHYGESPRRPDLDAVDLAAYTGIASLLLNLDETITKQ